jgi:hypothetical protein
LTRVVDSELTAVHALLLQDLLGLDSALDVNEVGVCETPRLTGTTVDGDSNVEDVLDGPEQVCENSLVMLSDVVSLLFLSLTIEVLVAHLVGHVANEQGLAGCGGTLAGPVLPLLAARLAAPVVLHRHSPALENLLVESVTGVVGCLLVGKLEVCKALAQTPVVGDESAVHDLAELGEFGLELRGGDLEEEVADVENLGGRRRGGFVVRLERSVGIDSVASPAADGGSGFLHSLGRLRGGSLCLLSHLRGGLLNLVGGRAELADCLRGLCSNIGDGLLGLLGKVGSLLGDGLGLGFGLGLGLVLALS